MNTFTINNDPLQTVQLIPIFTYLNALGEFLVIENYLSEANQTKPIPTVNALYEYLQYHRYSPHMKDDLIRRLLQGSDLYGAKPNEKCDITFANTLFEYIISSLVFDKYNNIYGFLTDVFLRAKNMQVDYVLKMIKESLASATFENEYGDRSILSSLSVTKIYSDIILPMFPQRDGNISLVSLDYIHAQAGLMFLRPGRTNTFYYFDYKDYVAPSIPDKNNLFDEFLVTGHVIRNLLQTQKKSIHMFKAFALPALIQFIFHFKHLYLNEDVSSIVSDPTFWKSAHNFLFQYITKAFKDIKTKVDNDHNLKLNLALSTFQSPSSLANTFMTFHCSDFNITAFLKEPKAYDCGINNHLSRINDLLDRQVDEIVKLYQIYDLHLVQETFEKYLILLPKDIKVVVKLLTHHDNVIDGVFSNSQQLTCDVIEFYFPTTRSFDYYLLLRENYNMTLIQKASEPELFEAKIGSSFEKFRTEASHVILKNINETFQDTWKNFIDYKGKRLQSYLKFCGVLRQGSNTSWKNNWWKEFALSIVPYFPCLSGATGVEYGEHNCTVNIVKILGKLQKESKLMNKETEDLLFSHETNIKSIFLKNECDEVIQVTLGEEEEKTRRKVSQELNEDEVWQHISLHLEEPAFALAVIAEDEIDLVKKITSAVKEKFNLNFQYSEQSLSKMVLLKSTSFKNVGASENGKQFIFVDTLDKRSDTGYGYKFLFLSTDTEKIAQLRTDYDRNKEIFLLPTQDDEKVFIVVNNATLEPEPDNLVYLVNTQFRRKYLNVSFHGIWNYHDDEKCLDKYYIGNVLPMNVCDRKWRYEKMLNNEENAIMLLRNKTDLAEALIRRTFKKYVFVDITALWEFTKNWMNARNLEEPDYSDFIVNDPELLMNLRYSLRLENHTVTEFDGKFRIDLLYTPKERLRIEEGTTIKNIVRDYNSQKAVYSVKFDEYYAIRNYATTGYMRIGGDTREAKLMKIALYKLAIRQSDDPEGEFELKLFTLKTVHVDFVKKVLSAKRSITLEKFTLAHISVASLLRFPSYAAPGFKNVIYEMVFTGRYLRAKIEQSARSREKLAILLPGSEFSIIGNETVQLGGLGRVLVLKLTFKQTRDIHVWYKNMLNEIALIKI